MGMEFLQNLGLKWLEAQTQMAYQKDQHILWLPSRICSGPGFQSFYTNKKVENSSAEHQTMFSCRLAADLWARYQCAASLQISAPKNLSLERMVLNPTRQDPGTYAMCRPLQLRLMPFNEVRNLWIWMVVQWDNWILPIPYGDVDQPANGDIS